MVLIEARPTIEQHTATVVLPVIIGWMRGHGQSPVDKAGFEQAVKHLCGVSLDAFAMAKYAETEWKWPSDTMLILVLNHGVTEAAKTFPDVVKAWVMANGIRFPVPPRSAVLFRDAMGELCHGIVQNLLPSTAEAVVALIADEADRSRETAMIRLRAEEVIERHAAV
jgi:hypothetical protein